MALLVLSVSSVGQAAWADSKVEHELQLWTPVYLTFPVHERVKGYFEVNPRVGDDLDEMSQLIIRPAAGYQVNGELSLWQGYAWIANFLPVFRWEHRLFQQLIYARAFEGVKVLSRSRFEERFIEDSRGVSLRARTMLRADVPLPGAPQWAFVVYNEIFVNLNSIRSGPEAGFDQDRFFAGVNRKLTGLVNMDAGYQLQLINTRASGLANQANHVILIQTFLTW